MVLNKISLSTKRGSVHVIELLLTVGRALKVYGVALHVTARTSAAVLDRAR
jgi:hypothetical protein